MHKPHYVRTTVVTNVQTKNKFRLCQNTRLHRNKSKKRHKR